MFMKKRTEVNAFFGTWKAILFMKNGFYSFVNVFLSGKKRFYQWRSQDFGLEGTQPPSPKRNFLRFYMKIVSNSLVFRDIFFEFSLI